MGASVRLLLGVSATLVGCRGFVPPRRALLPAELSVLAETRSGEPLSLLLGLRRNARDQLDVRVAEGAMVYDGHRVWEIRTKNGVTTALDHVSGDRRTLALPAGAHLLALNPRAAWVELGVARLRCTLDTGLCAPGMPPELATSHPGPGRGFRLSLEHGVLSLGLPQDEAEDLRLATGVSRLVSVAWVTGASGAAELVANRTFRGRARVNALARSVTLDGALDDWATAAPLVVDAPWQLQSGADEWGGPRDGSFSVAATWTADRICLAGRVRDDEVGPEDVLDVRVDAVHLAVPLEGATPEGTAVDSEWLGATWEACIPSSAVRPRDRLPFAVTFTDVDDGRTPTRLSSAPDHEGVPLGELLLDAPE